MPKPGPMLVGEMVPSSSLPRRPSCKFRGLMSPVSVKGEVKEPDEAVGVAYVWTATAFELEFVKCDSRACVMSKPSGRARDFIIRSRSSVVRRFSFARLRKRVSSAGSLLHDFCRDVGQGTFQLTDFGTTPGPGASSGLESLERGARVAQRRDAAVERTRS